MVLQPVLSYAHDLVARALHRGDQAIDGTAGNGYDTLFLAQQVGATGQVFAFDIQAGAIEAARARLHSARVLERVQLFHEGHEQIEARLHEVIEQGRLKAAMFNLGYLPGGDKSIITKPSTTQRALEGTLALLAPHGVIIVVLYPGHEGGREEVETILEWAGQLDPQRAQALHYAFLNSRRPAPSLLAIAKRGS